MQVDPRVAEIDPEAMDALLQRGQADAVAAMAPAPPIDPMTPSPAMGDENLALRLDEGARKSLAQKIQEEVRHGEQSRHNLIELQRKGILRLGVDRTIEYRTVPFQGASNVVHPAMMQAILDFAAMATKELSPPSGPCREQSSDISNAGSAKLGRFLNRMLTRKVKEWHAERDRLFMRLPVEGSTFMKTWFDISLQRPRCAYIPVDQIVMPYSDTGDPDTVPYFCHQQWLHASEVRGNIQSRLWVEHDPRVIQPMTNHSGGLRDLADQVIGHEQDQQTSELSGQYRYDEVAIWGYFEELKALGITQPQEWLATYEVETGTLVGLYDNRIPGRQGRRPMFCHYRMFPWVGAYGIGFFHAIGGLSDASTGALRALLDGAQIKSMPGGIFLGDDSSASGETLKIEPMTWKRIKRAGIRDVRQIAMPLPYDGPSPVLFQLLEFLTTQSREFASVSMQRIADMNNQAPVGTTLALIEGGARIYSAIHARLLDPTRRELELYRDHARRMPVEDLQELAEEDAEFIAGPGMPGLQPNVHPLPISTNESPSAVHRIAKAQAQLVIGQQAKDAQVPVNLRLFFVQAAMAMGIADAEALFPEPQPMNADAYSETAAALSGKSVPQVGPQDNHGEHIDVHLAMLKLPGLAAGPPGQMIIKHIVDHAAQASIMFDAQQPGMGRAIWQQVMTKLSESISLPDPAEKIAEVERLKVQQRAKSDANKMELALEQMQNETEKMLAQLEAKITLERETTQANIQEAYAKMQFDLEKIYAKADADAQARREQMVQRSVESEADREERREERTANLSERLPNET